MASLGQIDMECIHSAPWRAHSLRILAALRCSSCGHENREGRKFCAQCAAALSLSCPACSAANEPGEHFCGECGESLGERGQALPRAAPAQTPPALPASFASGRYQVRRFLGEGAKKRVFEAHDTLLDRDVAFALIKTEGLDSLGRQRVTEEAQALGRLGTHPNIVSVFDLGEHPSAGSGQAGQPFIVTELIASDTAAALREAGGPLPLEQTLAVAKDDAEAEFGTVREVGLKGLSGTHQVQSVDWAEHAV